MSTTQNETTRPISETIQQALQDAGYGSYMSYAQPVIAALTAREEAITEKLVGYAEANGADTEEVTAMLNDLGMAVRAPEPEAEESDENDGSDEGDGSDNSRIASALGRIEEQISRLTDFARRNGYRG